MNISKLDGIKDCEICGDSTLLSKHHIIPQEFTRIFKRYYKSKGLPMDPSLSKACNTTVILCRTCHDSIERSYQASEQRNSIKDLLHYIKDGKKRIHTLIPIASFAVQGCTAVYNKAMANRKKKIEKNRKVEEQLASELANILKEEIDDLEMATPI